MIKQGFMLEVESYEGDGDCYSTRNIDGLSKEDVLFYIDIFKGTAKIQNDCDCTAKQIIDTIAPIVVKHNFGMSAPTREIWLSKNIKENLAELYQKNFNSVITGYPGMDVDCEYFLRAVDGWKIYYIPQEIHEVFL